MHLGTFPTAEAAARCVTHDANVSTEDAGQRRRLLARAYASQLADGCARVARGGRVYDLAALKLRGRHAKTNTPAEVRAGIACIALLLHARARALLHTCADDGDACTCDPPGAQHYLGDAAVAQRLEQDTREDFLQARLRAS
jgi:hypothetical protein